LTTYEHSYILKTITAEKVCPANHAVSETIIGKGEKVSLKYRHELKFLCTEHNLRHMEEKVRHICKTDSHAGSSGSYVIRSLYFDTYADHCYAANLSGIDDRKKYRLRIYDSNPEFIRLECKYSHHGLKAKEQCILTDRQCKTLLQGNSLLPTKSDSDELLKYFLLERSSLLLTPRVVVEYTRTPYVFPAGNVRITFDRTIRSSAQTRHFLDRNLPFRNILPDGMHILEVKYDEFLPSALGELLAGGQDLRRTSFSKYSLCRNYSTV
jgi:hypothetical protein